jgi:rRNA maturation RNase YbeY
MTAIAVFNAHPARRRRRKETMRAVRTVLAGEGRRRAVISVVFVNDRFMTKMNGAFLRHRGTTDVISFPLGERGTTEGEVYVNLDSAVRQSREYGESYAREAMRLVIHGTLHLLGYDDRTTGKRKTMKQREERYVNRVANARAQDR